MPKGQSTVTDRHYHGEYGHNHADGASPHDHGAKHEETSTDTPETDDAEVDDVGNGNSSNQPDEQPTVKDHTDDSGSSVRKTGPDGGNNENQSDGTDDTDDNDEPETPSDSGDGKESVVTPIEMLETPKTQSGGGAKASAFRSRRR